MKHPREHGRILFNANWVLGWLVATALVSLLVACSVIWSQFNTQQSMFKQRVDLARKQIEQQDQKINTILQATASMYQAETSHDDYGFNVFSRSVIGHLPFVKLLGVAKSESLADMPNLTAWMQDQGYENFSLKCGHLFQEETCPATWQNPKKEDSVSVMPMVQLEPFTAENSVFLGQNLFSLPGAKSSMMDSIIHNHSQMLTLVGQAGRVFADEHFMLIYRPFFRPSLEPLTLEQRKRYLRGVVFVLLNLRSTVEAIQPLFSDFGEVKVEIEASQNGKFESAFLKSKTTTFQLHNSFTIDDFNANFRYELQKSFGLHDIKFWPVFWALLLSWWVLAILTGLFYQLRQHSTQLETQKLRMEKIFETSHDAVIVLNETGHILEWNPEAERFFEHKADSAKGQMLFEMLKPLGKTSSKGILDWLGIELVNGSKNNKQVIILNADKEQQILDMACSVISIKQGFEISLFLRDQTAQHQAQAKVQHLAYYDALTQLKNRISFEQKMQSYFDEGKSFSILFFDLDGFKQINDALGHTIGDELLKVLAKRLQHWKQGQAYDVALSRFGGDEFVIMIDINDGLALKQIALNILALMAETVHIFHHDIHISASLGISRFPENGDNVSVLLKRADLAMYAAKANGHNSYAFYDILMEQSLEREMLIQKNLRLGLKRKEFYLEYQPKINLKTGQVEAVEALIRWDNFEMGIIRPDEFIPIAERSHLILPIGDWVIKESIRQMSQWQQTLPQIQHIAINVSSVQLEHPRFVEKLNRLLRHTDLPPQAIEIELTERIVMSNVQAHLEKLHEIRQHQYGLSVDDFGTGYSSLSYLKRLPLTTLKIDKSFVDGLPNETEDVAIASAIIEMAHSLKLKVVAEGVETRAQLEFMQQYECDYVQGFFTGRPMRSEKLQNWIQQQPQFDLE